MSSVTQPVRVRDLARPAVPWWPEAEPTGRTSLTAAGIARAAAEIIDAEGLDRLSIRRVASELDIGAMTLYWHLEDKEQLLDLVLDELIGDVKLPRCRQWDQVLAAYARNLREVVVEHRRMAPLLGSTRRTGPNAVALAEAMTSTISAAGFEPERLPAIYQTVLNFTIGSALMECLREVPSDESLALLDAEQVPTLVQHQDAFAALGPSDSFESGLELIIEALRRESAP